MRSGPRRLIAGRGIVRQGDQPKITFGCRVGIGLGLADQIAHPPGDVPFAEQEEADRGGQRVFVRPAEMDFRRRADPRKLQGDRGDHVGHRRAARAR